MHDEIIRYSMDGIMTDGNIVAHKDRLVSFVEGQMRDQGVVPSLDLDPQFTLDYQPESETYKFSLTVYGIFAGKEDSWTTAGIMAGTTIQRHIPQVKLSQS